MAGKNPYSSIIRMVNQANKAQTMAEQFVADIDRYYQLSKEKYIPSKTIKPSSIAGCYRLQYFMLVGEEQDVGSLDDANMITIGHSGTDRHERLQYVMQDACNYNIPIVWVEPEEAIRRAQQMGINTIIKRRDGNELLCYNSDLNIQFKCDGIIQYKDKVMILEIKTEISRNWGARIAPKPEHELQAICYSLGFGIDSVMFVYENRDTTQRKAYEISITNEQKEYVKKRSAELMEYVRTERVPPKEKDKCIYCHYKQACRKAGDEDGPKIKF